MGQKGDRASKEPLAIRMYADGQSIEAIAAALSISPTSLRTWKGQTFAPGAEIDEWDRARQQKRNMFQRLKDIYEEQVAYIESLHPQDRTAPAIDALSKMGALVEKHETKAKTEKAVSAIEAKVQEKMTPREILQIVKEEVYGIA